MKGTIMIDPTNLAIELVNRLSVEIEEWDERNFLVVQAPLEVQPKNLLRMCHRIEEKAVEDEWPDTKLHRWIGHLHGCMLTLGIVDIDRLKEIMSQAKKVFGEKEDEELKDHCNPDNFFSLDIGGEG